MPPHTMLIDSHCHLDFPEFEDCRDAVMERARAAGVGRVVTIGISRPDFEKNIRIAERYEDVYCCLGVHAHEAEKPGEAITVSDYEAIVRHPKVIGIGETGFDFHYDHAPRDAQERNFRTHIRACIATGLPLIIHTREAEAETIRILAEERAGHEDKLTGVLHCFSSKPEMAAYGVEIGFYVSFSGMLTFNKADDIRAVAATVPMDRLLIETDAPFLAPVPFRGKTCEPAHVVQTAARLAAVRGVSVAEIETATTENFFRLFKKARPNLLAPTT